MGNIFRPKAKTLVLFLLFALIAVGGYVQATAFGPDDELKRHDWFLQLPLWETWVVLGAPVHLVWNAVERYGTGVMSRRTWLVLYFAAQMVYFYFLAVVIIAIADAASRRLSPRL